MLDKKRVINTRTQNKPHSIQMTLVDYFMGSNTFSLTEATEHVREVNNDVKASSIRARVYEGTNKGLFGRIVDKGICTVTRNVNSKSVSCMLINGDGRKLTNIPDNAIDVIITDHPYLDEKSHKGGARNFTSSYDCFKYIEEDFKEKYRVMKKGCFLAEFVPEENANNFEYLYQLKTMAIKQGFRYYAKVPWMKEGFVANTGRKSTNVEEVMIFSKGKARELRIDAKKNKQEPGQEHFMSGTNRMLPTAFKVNPVSKKERIHQAEKPLALLEQIIEFVSKEGEVILDQFAGSGVLGEAALNKGRNSILIEKDKEKYEKIKLRLDSKGEISMSQEKHLTDAAEKNKERIHYYMGDGTPKERREAKLQAQENALHYYDLRDGDGNVYSIEDFAVVDNIGYMITDKDILVENAENLTEYGKRWEEAEIIFNKYDMQNITKKEMNIIAEERKNVHKVESRQEKSTLSSRSNMNIQKSKPIVITKSMQQNKKNTPNQQQKINKMER